MPRPIDEELADVPAYKRGYFSRHDQAQNWRHFNLGLERMRGMGANERFSYREINAAEGGGVPDRSDPTAPGPAVGGLTAKTLSQLDIPGVAPGALPTDLKPWQLPHGYRGYFDREFASAGGSKTLEEIKHSGVAAFVADTVFREGNSGVGMIQDSVNAIRIANGQGRIKRDSIFGEETLGALNEVSAKPEDRQIFSEQLRDLRNQRRRVEKARNQHFFELSVD